jgi:UDPglucose 6-dehydrogenase
MNIAIVGHGFVGQAVEYGFEHKLVNATLIDPKYNTSVEDLYDKDIQAAFVCVPTPMSDDGKIDASIVEDVTRKLIDNTNALVILKSTVTPEIVKSLAEIDEYRFVYNPEFLTERNAKDDFVKADFHVFGGHDVPVTQAEGLYYTYSKCFMYNTWVCSAVEASFVKYAINTFLATKVTFFNQLKDQTDKFGCNFEDITDIISQDRRIGSSHMQAPGPDGKRGFGGACFPKDTNAMARFSNGEFSLLKNVLTINSEYRKLYELDEREKEMNVTFGDINVDNG